MTEHSPTPWRVVERVGSPPCIKDANGDTVCFVDGATEVAHIVRCVNVHDGLVGRLWDCVDAPRAARVALSNARATLATVGAPQ